MTGPWAAAPVLACAAALIFVPAETPNPVLSGYTAAVEGIPAASTILVSSPVATGEGAIVVARLLADRNRQGIVLRASKVLGIGNWNGNLYRLLLPDEESIDAFLQQSPVRFIVIEEGGKPKPHQWLLQTALKGHGDRYVLLRSQPLAGNRVTVYQNRPAAKQPVKPILFSLGAHRRGMMVGLDGHSESGRP